MSIFLTFWRLRSLRSGCRCFLAWRQQTCVLTWPRAERQKLSQDPYKSTDSIIPEGSTLGTSFNPIYLPKALPPNTGRQGFNTRILRGHTYSVYTSTNSPQRGVVKPVANFSKIRLISICPFPLPYPPPQKACHHFTYFSGRGLIYFSTPMFSLQVVCETALPALLQPPRFPLHPVAF